MKANEPSIYPKNTPRVAATAAGEIDIGLVNYYSISAGSCKKKVMPSVSVIIIRPTVGRKPCDGRRSWYPTSVNRENAEKFLRFMRSKVGQQYFTGQTYEYPLVEGVRTNRLLTAIDKINKPSIDMTDFQAHEFHRLRSTRNRGSASSRLLHGELCQTGVSNHMAAGLHLCCPISTCIPWCDSIVTAQGLARSGEDSCSDHASGHCAPHRTRCTHGASLFLPRDEGASRNTYTRAIGLQNTDHDRVVRFLESILCASSRPGLIVDRDIFCTNGFSCDT